MTIKLREKTNITGIAIALIAVLLLSACGGDDEPASSSSGSTSTGSTSSGSTTQSITTDTTVDDDNIAAPADPVAAPKIDPPAVSVTTKDPVEPGSIEEKVLAVLEKQVTTTNTWNFKGFLETCQPDRHIISEEQLEHIFVEFGGEFGYDIPSFSIEGYNARGVEFRVYSDENVRTTFDIFNYDEWVASGVSRTWVNVEGEWYSDGLTCHGIGG